MVRELTGAVRLTQPFIMNLLTAWTRLEITRQHIELRNYLRAEIRSGCVGWVKGLLPGKNQYERIVINTGLARNPPPRMTSMVGYGQGGS
jgi:hypothetical protein